MNVFCSFQKGQLFSILLLFMIIISLLPPLAFACTLHTGEGCEPSQLISAERWDVLSENDVNNNIGLIRSQGGIDYVFDRILPQNYGLLDKGEIESNLDSISPDDYHLIPWEKGVDQSMVHQRNIARIPHDKVNVLEVSDVLQLSYEQLAFGNNLELLSAGDTPSLYKLNPSELARAINTVSGTSVVLTLNSLSPSARFDRLENALQNGNGYILMDQFDENSPIIEVIALEGGGFTFRIKEDLAIDVTTGTVVADRDSHFSIINQYGASVIEIPDGILGTISALDDGKIILPKGTTLRRGSLHVFASSDNVQFQGTEDQFTVTGASDIVRGSERVLLSERGSLLYNNGDITASRAEAFLNNDYLSGDFSLSGDSIHIRNGLHIDLETGIGSRGTNVRVHKDSISPHSRFSDQDGADSRPSTDEIREKARELQDISESYDGEVWIRNTDDGVFVYAKGKVDVRSYDTDFFEPINDFVYTSVDDSGILDMRLDSGEFDLFMKGKSRFVRGETYHAEGRTIELDALALEGFTTGSIIGYSNLGGVDQLQVTCTNCDLEDDVALVSRGILQYSRGLLVQDSLPILYSVAEQDGVSFISPHIDVAALQRFASRNNPDSFVVLRDSLSIDSGAFTLDFNENGDIKITSADGIVSPLFSFNNARSELGEEAMIYIASDEEFLEKEYELNAFIREQNELALDFGKQIEAHAQRIQLLRDRIAQNELALEQTKDDRGMGIVTRVTLSDSGFRQAVDGLERLIAQNRIALQNALHEMAVLNDEVAILLDAIDDRNSDYLSFVLESLSSEEGYNDEAFNLFRNDLTQQNLMAQLRLAYAGGNYAKVGELGAVLSDNPDTADAAYFFRGMADLKKSSIHADSSELRRAYHYLSQVSDDGEFSSQRDSVINALDTQILSSVELRLTADQQEIYDKISGMGSIRNAFNPVKALMAVHPGDALGIILKTSPGTYLLGDYISKNFEGKGYLDNSLTIADLESTRLTDEQIGVMTIQTFRRMGHSLDDIRGLRQSDIQEIILANGDSISSEQAERMARTMQRNIRSGFQNPDVSRLYSLSQDSTDQRFNIFIRDFQYEKGYLSDAMDGVGRWTIDTSPYIGIDAGEFMIDLANAEVLVPTLLGFGVVGRAAAEATRTQRVISAVTGNQRLSIRPVSGSALRSNADNVFVSLSRGTGSALSSAATRVGITESSALYGIGARTGKVLAAPVAVTERIGSRGGLGRGVQFVGENLVIEPIYGIAAGHAAESAAQTYLGVSDEVGAGINFGVNMLTQYAAATGHVGYSVRRQARLNINNQIHTDTRFVDDIISANPALDRSSVQSALQRTNVDLTISGAPNFARFNADLKANLGGVDVEIPPSLYQTFNVEVPVPPARVDANSEVNTRTNLEKVRADIETLEADRAVALQRARSEVSSSSEARMVDTAPSNEEIGAILVERGVMSPESATRAGFRGVSEAQAKAYYADSLPDLVRSDPSFAARIDDLFGVDVRRSLEVRPSAARSSSDDISFHNDAKNKVADAYFTEAKTQAQAQRIADGPIAPSPEPVAVRDVAEHLAVQGNLPREMLDGRQITPQSLQDNLVLYPRESLTTPESLDLASRGGYTYRPNDQTFIARDGQTASYEEVGRQVDIYRQAIATGYTVSPQNGQFYMAGRRGAISQAEVVSNLELTTPQRIVSSAEVYVSTTPANVRQMDVKLHVMKQEYDRLAQNLAQPVSLRESTVNPEGVFHVRSSDTIPSQSDVPRIRSDYETASNNYNKLRREYAELPQNADSLIVLRKEVDVYNAQREHVLRKQEYDVAVAKSDNERARILRRSQDELDTIGAHVERITGEIDFIVGVEQRVSNELGFPVTRGEDGLLIGSITSVRSSLVSDGVRLNIGERSFTLHRDGKILSGDTILSDSASDVLLRNIKVRTNVLKTIDDELKSLRARVRSHYSSESDITIRQRELFSKVAQGYDTQGTFSELLWTHNTGFNELHQILSSGSLRPGVRGVNLRQGLQSEYFGSAESGGPVVLVFNPQVRNLPRTTYNDFYGKGLNHYSRSLSENDFSYRLAQDFTFNRYTNTHFDRGYSNPQLEINNPVPTNMISHIIIPEFLKNQARSIARANGINPDIIITIPVKSNQDFYSYLVSRQNNQIVIGNRETAESLGLSRPLHHGRIGPSKNNRGVASPEAYFELEKVYMNLLIRHNFRSQVNRNSEILDQIRISSDIARRNKEFDNLIVLKARETFNSDVWSTGSSARQTYISDNDLGLPPDFDIIVKVNNFNADRLNTMTSDYMNSLMPSIRKTYGNDIAVVAHKFRQGPPNRDYGQTFLTIHKLRMGETPEDVLRKFNYGKGSYKQANIDAIGGIDITFKTQLDGSERYTDIFNKQLRDATQHLSPTEASLLEDHINTQIRAFKKVLDDNKLYTKKDGGLKGIGSEQTIMQLGDGVTIKTLQDGLDLFTVRNGLKRIHDQQDALFLPNPSKKGENLIDSTGVNVDRLRALSRNYNQYNSLSSSVTSKVVFDNLQKKMADLSVLKNYIDSYAGLQSTSAKRITFPKAKALQPEVTIAARDKNIHPIIHRSYNTFPQIASSIAVLAGTYYLFNSADDLIAFTPLETAFFSPELSYGVSSDSLVSGIISYPDSDHEPLVVAFSRDTGSIIDSVSVITEEQTDIPQTSKETLEVLAQVVTEDSPSSVISPSLGTTGGSVSLSSGLTADVVAVVPVDISVNYILDHGYSSTIRDVMRNRVSAYLNSLGRGDIVSYSRLFSEICLLEGVLDCELKTPQENIILEPNQVARLGSFA